MIASDKENTIFSQNNACPHCGVTIGDLEPRTFSFNSPFGSCKACNGLGVKMEFNPDLVIPDKSKSLLDGAIVPWSGRASSFRRQELRAVGKKFGFNLMTPINQIKPKQLEAILHGTDKMINYKYQSKSSDSYWEYSDKFEGVLNNLHRIFMETESESKREWLKQFMLNTPCNSCNGKKLKPEALAVTVNGKGIMEVCDLSIDECYDFFQNLKLTETESYIARDVLKEIKERVTSIVVKDNNDNPLLIMVERNDGTIFLKNAGEAGFEETAAALGIKLNGCGYERSTFGISPQDEFFIRG